jgi:aminoglycoside phosphotransferase (APT) family kinase protein
VTDPHETAVRLGRFLRALHQAAPSDAPDNPYRSVPLTSRTDVDDRMARLAPEIDVDAIRRTWDGAVTAGPWTGPPVWLHGDLHPANTLVADGTLAAVIDFGDLCSGDPATDLAGAWMLLPSSALDIFLAAYGGIDDALERRSLGWAALFGLNFVDIGLRHRASYETVGRATLDRVIDYSQRFDD